MLRDFYKKMELPLCLNWNYYTFASLSEPHSLLLGPSWLSSTIICCHWYFFCLFHRMIRSWRQLWPSTYLKNRWCLCHRPPSSAPLKAETLSKCFCPNIIKSMIQVHPILFWMSKKIRMKYEKWSGWVSFSIGYNGSCSWIVKKYKIALTVCCSYFSYCYKSDGFFFFIIRGLREMFPYHLDLEVYCDVALC